MTFEIWQHGSILLFVCVIATAQISKHCLEWASGLLLIGLGLYEYFFV